MTILDAESQAVEPFLKCTYTGISSRAHFQCRCQFLRMSHLASSFPMQMAIPAKASDDLIPTRRAGPGLHRCWSVVYADQERDSLASPGVVRWRGHLIGLSTPLTLKSAARMMPWCWPPVRVAVIFSSILLSDTGPRSSSSTSMA